MWTLGFHGGFGRDHLDGDGGFGGHDGAAVLLRDGELVAAIENERINRVKHCNNFPERAIRFCLQYAGISLTDVDHIAACCTENSLAQQMVIRIMQNPGRVPFDTPDLYSQSFQECFGESVADRMRYKAHHHAHAASAYYPSAFEDALVVTIDGDGEGYCGTVAEVRKNQWKVRRSIPTSQSLGAWYSVMIGFLGYNRFDEYKVMGLAPYGDPSVYRSLFRKFYSLKPDGEYELLPPANQFVDLHATGFLRNRRQKGEEFNQLHRDYAAALQETLETIVEHILVHYRKDTGLTRLCLSGGVAHNCSMNGRILNSGLFDEVYVQPLAHDAGTALGAAWLVANDHGIALDGPMPHLFLGTPVVDAEIEAKLERWSMFLDYERDDEIEASTAELLAAGKVIGWVQGRSEFGPRALGNRSILGDPRPPENKRIINQMVKKREGYRPFAPSVQAEHVRDYFKLPPGHDALPFMIFVVDVQDDQREKLGAITHVDGTARVQTVSRDDNPRYWKLLDEFGNRTGIPMLLNTSFNNNAEPIVDSVEDAIRCYLTTGIHHLVAGNFLATKKPVQFDDPCYLCLAPSLAHQHRLTRHSAPGKPDLQAPAYSYQFYIETSANEYFGKRRVEISETVHRLMMSADGRRSLKDLFDDLAVVPSGQKEIVEELVDLWAFRRLDLAPV